MRPLSYLLVAATGLSLLPGCGAPTIAPVRGRVTCNGKPVADAALIFSPIPKNENDKESGKAAAGGTDENGYFVLSTYKERDGALIGKHRVSVTVDEGSRKVPCKSKVLEIEIKPGDNEVNIELDK
jgi:hypothetical protein